jgi:hypothetical protein
MSAELTFEQRLALVRKLKEILLLQREKFRAYLYLLGQEERVIIESDVEKLEHHIETEQGIMRELAAFEKVIEPLEAMYSLAFPNKEAEIPPLQQAIEIIKREALERNSRNRCLLKTRMEDLKREMASIRRKGPPPSPKRAAETAFVDVNA